MKRPPVPELPPHPFGYVHSDVRSDVFDPALKHYGFAYVKSAPEGAEARARFDQGRRRAISAGLAAIAESIFAGQLVVRGSAAMTEWFPESARSPKDLDLVVLPATFAAEEAGAMLAQLIEELRRALESAGFEAAPAAIDSIWTYERAEGRRLTIAWSRENVHGELQVDLVFREPMIEAPVLTDMMTVLGAVKLLFATKAESLAWKLLWLTTDSFPQAKDLYDAVLLAKAQPLSRTLLDRVFQGKGEKPLSLTDLEACTIDPTTDSDFGREAPSMAALMKALRLTE